MFRLLLPFLVYLQRISLLCILPRPDLLRIYGETQSVVVLLQTQEVLEDLIVGKMLRGVRGNLGEISDSDGQHLCFSVLTLMIPQLQHDMPYIH